MGLFMGNNSSDLKTEKSMEKTDSTQHTLNQQASQAAKNEHQTTQQQGAETKETGNVFTELLGELGDHPGLYIGNYHVADLPVFLVDNGFHAYSSPQSMEEAGLYKMYKGHPVRSADQHAPALDLSITNLVVFQWVAIIILFVFFRKAAARYKKNPSDAPKGVQNLVESVFVYVKEKMVAPNISGKHIVDRLLPYFGGLFFFILMLNLMGLIPGAHTATGTVSVTAALAITAFIVINFTAIRESGIGAWFHHLLGGAPWWLFPIMVPIELLSMFIKPFALTIRLFANMIAGHVVLLSLLGLMFFFKTILISPAIVGFSVFIYGLELLVAFIQAYIFTMLTAIFVGLAIGEHGGEHETAHS
jgi:F-type H+-transporting ATPase subunit a